MLDFTRRNFVTWVEIFLWLNLITGIIIGWKTGGASGSTPFSILGAIVGLAWGFISNILIGGFISVILKIDENLETIKDNSFGAETPEKLLSSSKNTRGKSEPLNLL